MVKRLHIAICDDEIFQRELIGNKIADFFSEKSISYTVEEFSSGEEVLNYCRKKDSLPIDILLLDIEMSGIDGISLKDNIFYQSKIKYIIFISSFRERIDETFGNKTLGFLGKPISDAPFNRLFQKACQLIQQEELILIYDIDNVPHNIRISEIAYLQSSGEWSEVHFSSGKETIMIKAMLSEAINSFRKAQIVRISRFIAISLNYVSKMSSEVVFTKDGQQFKLGRVYKHTSREAFMNYLKVGNRQV